VEKVIEKNKSLKQYRLPTICELAKQGGFSPKTISRAVAFFRKQSILSASQRSGVQIVSNLPVSGTGEELSDQEAPPQKKGNKSWQKLRSRFAADIAAGVYQPGTLLPSGKELCATFGTAHVTIKKALESLTSEGLLVPYKRGYRLRSYRARRSTSTLCFVADNSDLSRLLNRTPHSMEMWQNLVMQCRQRGLRIINTDKQKIAAKIRKAKSDLSGIIGFVVWPMGLLDRDIADLVRDLAMLNLPCSFLDEIGTVPLHPLIRAYPKFKVFSLANSVRAGRVMAHYLLAHNHYSIAYFSNFGKQVWCKRRYQGISEVYAEAGYENAVTRFTLNEGLHLGKFKSFLQKKEQMPGLEKRWKLLIEEFDPGTSHNKSILQQTEVLRYLQKIYLYKKLVPKIEEANNHKHITAWVGSNDATTEMLIRFLDESKRSRKTRPYLMGFDDTMRSFVLGFPSFNFNMQGLVSAMLEHILNPPERGDTAESQSVEIDGFVVEK